MVCGQLLIVYFAECEIGRKIEETMDRGEVAMAPLPLDKNQLTKWTILLVNPKMKNDTAIERIFYVSRI